MDNVKKAAADELCRLAKVIRAHGSCAPAALEGVAARLREPAGVGGEWVLVPRSDLLEEDSYGVHGSEFYRCKLCGNESGAGLLNKGIEHSEDCPLAAPQPPTEAQARPEKPAECADGCPAQQVCDHCQWPPGPDAEAQAQGGGEVVVPWIEEWQGSGPQRGYHIREATHLHNNRVVAYLGDQVSGDEVDKLIAEHNGKHPNGEPVRIPSAKAWCDENAVATTGEWQAGWDACRVEFPRTAPPSAPVGVEAAKHWHDLYRKECQLRQDDAARYGQQIVELEALAQQPAAVDGAMVDRLRRDIAELHEAMPMLPITAETMEAATDWFTRYCIDFYREINAAQDAALAAQPGGDR